MPWKCRTESDLHMGDGFMLEESNDAQSRRHSSDETENSGQKDVVLRDVNAVHSVPLHGAT